MDPLFAALPENLSDVEAVSSDDLTALEASYVEALTKIRDKDAEFLGDRDAPTILAELRAGREALDAVRAEIAERAQAEATFDAEVDELTAVVAPEPEAPEADATLDADADASAEGEDEEKDKDDDEDAETQAAVTDDAEPVVDAEETPAAEEAVTAAGGAKPRVLRSKPARAGQHAPMVIRDRAEQSSGAKLTSTMEFGGVQRGLALQRNQMIELLDDAIVRTEGTTQRTVLASARAKFPGDRMLSGDVAHNNEIVKALQAAAQGRDADTILASGGRCAPFPPIYDLPFVATSRRPVQAALLNLGAPRGGITFPTPLTISDAAGGITIVTALEDATEGSATKTCVVVDCDEFLSAETQAIAGCVEHGNFGARSWPERVDNLSDLLRVAHAIAGETALLDAIKAGSNTVADEAKYGLVSTLLQGILKAGAAMRNRHRMEPDVTLRVLLPAWILDAMVADVNHNAFNRFVAHAEVQALFARMNVVATFYLDSPTGGSMVYGAADATNLDEFKTTVEWAIFPEATWAFLDGGRLDLGLIRDSVLNATNDFQLFFETWEGAANLGVDSQWVTSTICPSGATAPAGTLITC